MKTKRYLNVAWTDLSWEVHIRNRPRGGCRLDREILRLVCSRFEPFAVPAAMYRVSLKSSRPRSGGFTIVELLVVIAIIAILASILLPTLGNVKTKAKVANARTEMSGMAAAIKAYEGDYNRYPASKDAELANPNMDFTYGTTGTLPAPLGGHVINPPAWKYNGNNSEVVLLLLDIDQGINAQHVRNPRKIKYWNPKMVSSDLGGVSTVDYVSRDPWGMPYIITLDMNDDNKCVDAIYSLKDVSERDPNQNAGHNGLSRPAQNAPFELNGPVMIWSLGPDKRYDATARANADPNKDNVLSWSN